jgi:hypothetical protein
MIKSYSFMKTRHLSLSAVALIASVALILPSIAGSGGVAVAADIPFSTLGETDFFPQQLNRGQNTAGQTFWFPALYGKDKYNQLLEGGALTVEGERLTLDTIQKKAEGDDIELTVPYSYKVEILTPALPDGKTPGTAKLVATEAMKGALSMPTRLEIPEFVWAIAPDIVSSDTIYLPYRVTTLANDFFSFVIDEESTGNAYKYREFYFNPQSSGTRETKGKTLAELGGNYPQVDYISFTAAIPKVVNAENEPDSLRFYGLLKSSEATIRILPTRFTKTPESTTTVLTEGYGSVFFYGNIHGADKIASQLAFGLSEDKRDKSLSKTDFANLASLLSGTGSKKVTSSKGLWLNLYGANKISGDQSDRVPFNLFIEPGAFTADNFSARFNKIFFHSGLAGDLGDAGFAALKDSFNHISFYYDKSGDTPWNKAGYASRRSGDSIPSGLTFNGDSLFAGKIISHLYLPDYLTEIGKAWFYDAKIGDFFQYFDYYHPTESGNDFLSKVTAIGESAFEKAKIGTVYGNSASPLSYFGKVNSFTASGIVPGTPFKAAENKEVDKSLTLLDAAIVSIGARAFYGAEIGVPSSADTVDLSWFRFATSIGDSAFAFVKSPNQHDIIGGFGHFKYLASIGKGIFHGDTLLVPTITGNKIEELLNGQALTVKDTVITIPSDRFLSAVPANLFEGVKLKAVSAASGKYTTLSGSKFYLSEDAVPSGVGINKDVFYGDTVYAHYLSFEAWKPILKTSVVIAYGLPKSTTLVARVFNTDNGRTFGLNDDSTYYTYPYDLSGYNLKLDFSTAIEEKGATYYAITGPKAAEGFGFLTDTDEGEYVEFEATPEVGKSGIVIPPNLPAGLYNIYTLAVGSGQKPDTTLLYVQPIDLSELVIDTLSYTYVGDKVADLLNSITLSTLTIRDKYTLAGENNTITFTDADAQLIHLTITTLQVDTAAKAKATKVAILRGTGNYAGASDVYLAYRPIDLSVLTADDITLTDVNFTGTEKNYPFNGTLTVKSSGFDVPLSYGQDNLVSLSYVAPDKVTSESIPVTVKANKPKEGIPNVIGSTDKAAYKLIAPWKLLAEYNYKDIIRKNVTFDGTPYTLSTDLIKLAYLNPGEYALVAVEEHSDGTLTSVEELEDWGNGIYRGALTPNGVYDVYIIPAGTYVAEYEKKDNAHFAGTIEYDKLPLADLINAFKLVLAPEGAAGSPYALAVDKAVYAGDYTYVSSGNVFIVTIGNNALAGIDAGEGTFDGSFTVSVPTALPTALSFVTVDEEGNEIDFPLLTIRVGDEPYDLSQHLRADKDAKLDFLKDIEWSTKGKEGKVIVDENGFVIALTEWDGVSVIATVKGSDPAVKATIAISAELSNAIASAIVSKRSVSYADGTLTLKGFAGTTATLYRLNGVPAAKLSVTSDAAAYSVALPKGFYLVKVGATITKIVVR